LPFFRPIFRKGNSFCLYGERKKAISFEALIKETMKYPYFPVPLEKLGATLQFTEINPGDTLVLGDNITVRSTANNHPDGRISYCIQYGNKFCCYVTDYEHGPEKAQGLLELCAEMVSF
jgi:phosphoribosyl 1,2-cyclic phosphodiesterase